MRYRAQVFALGRVDELPDEGVVLLDHKGREIGGGAGGDGGGSVSAATAAAAAAAATAATAATAASTAAAAAAAGAAVHNDLLGAIAELEAESYPADEKASEERLRQRAKVAPQHFRVLWLVHDTGSRRADKAWQLCGFVCGTARDRERLDEEAMATHDEGGQSLCVHSVVTASGWRRRGLARFAVRQYLKAARAEAKGLKRSLLLCKPSKKALYEQAGYELIAPWPHTHGQDQWLEMQHMF